MDFAFQNDANNTWFCFLTDSCCPIISPQRFRYLFYKGYHKSLLSWKPAWWNIDFHKRANLALLPEEYRLANDPWFIFKRENVWQTLQFVKRNKEITKTVTAGGLANESLFAIVMAYYKQLGKNVSTDIISAVTHLADWDRRSSPTSPHLFKDGNETDIAFIERELERNKYAIFIRKIAIEFPDELLNHYIYDYSKEKDDKLVIREPRVFFGAKKYISSISFPMLGLGMIVLFYFFVWFILLN
jgi:hypothetical protein